MTTQFIKGFDPAEEIKEIYLDENSDMTLVTNKNTHESKVFVCPLGKSSKKIENVFLKDAEWEVQDREDLHNLDINAGEMEDKQNLIVVIKRLLM
jgi:hypothetical protein